MSLRVTVMGAAAAILLSACANVPVIGANHGEALPSDSLATTTSAPVTGAKYSTNTSMGVLLDTPSTRQVLERHIPKVVGDSRISMARGMSLKSVAGFGQSGIDKATLAAIDRDLAQVH